MTVSQLRDFERFEPEQWMKAERRREVAVRLAKFLLIAGAAVGTYFFGVWMTGAA